MKAIATVVLIAIIALPLFTIVESIYYFLDAEVAWRDFWFGFRWPWRLPMWLLRIPWPWEDPSLTYYVDTPGNGVYPNSVLFGAALGVPTMFFSIIFGVKKILYMIFED